MRWNAGDTSLSQITHLNAEPHNGHKVNLIFEFSSGEKVVYKPRSFSAEMYYYKIAGRLQGLSFRPCMPHLIEKDGYGWMEFIDLSVLPSVTPVELSFQSGTILAISSAAKVYDLHAENVMLSRYGAMMIDAEAIGLSRPRPINGSIH